MTKEDVYQDYLLIRKMRTDTETKRKILERVVSRAINGWRVIGITKPALRRFHENGFAYKSRSGVQRAHIIERKITYTGFIETEHTEADFWKTLAKNDRTILTIEGERTFPEKFEVIYFKPEPLLFSLPSETNFGSKSVGYRHNKREKIFLEQLYKKYLTL